MSPFLGYFKNGVICTKDRWPLDIFFTGFPIQSEILTHFRIDTTIPADRGFIISFLPRIMDFACNEDLIADLLIGLGFGDFDGLTDFGIKS